MYKVKVKTPNGVSIERVFNDSKLVKDFLLVFLNPIKDSLIGKIASKCDLPIKEYFLYDLNITLEAMATGNIKESWSSIVNGGNSKSPENIEYNIEYIDVNTYYVQPKAWHESLEILEVFPKNHLELLKSFNSSIDNLDKEEIHSCRIGLIDSEESMKKYRNLGSCRPSIDEEFVIGNKKFMFGCNYEPKKG